MTADGALQPILASRGFGWSCPHSRRLSRTKIDEVGGKLYSFLAIWPRVRHKQKVMAQAADPPVAKADGMAFGVGV